MTKQRLSTLTFAAPDERVGGVLIAGTTFPIFRSLRLTVDEVKKHTPRELVECYLEITAEPRREDFCRAAVEAVIAGHVQNKWYETHKLVLSPGVIANHEARLRVARECKAGTDEERKTFGSERATPAPKEKKVRPLKPEGNGKASAKQIIRAGVRAGKTNPEIEAEVAAACPLMRPDRIHVDTVWLRNRYKKDGDKHRWE